MVDQQQPTANNKAQYDTIASQYVKYKETNVREAVEHYTIYNCLLKPYLNEHGLLTGKRALDLGCGYGYYTRQWNSLNCSYVLGVDISSTMIELARNIERQEAKGIEYMIADIKELSPPEQPFDLVTGFYVLHYSKTQAELLEMARAIYIQLGENKPFIGTIGNVVAGKASFNHRKYGITRCTDVSLSDDSIPDGTEVIVTFYSDQDEPMCTFSHYHWSSTTYEQVFKEVGFKTFQWIPYQYDPNASNRAFFDDLLNCSPSIGIIATK
ncbi:unnamed protein product [Rotaria sp. Silwood2]|nr:unnamed protein product [Rotaria sp. Silwood2]CAF4441262.1 unnamed protein product [Rotaria sp. Silwood2]